MKRFIIVLLFLPLCAAQVYDLDISIDLNEKNEALIEFHYNLGPRTKEITMPLYFPIKELTSTGGQCYIMNDYQDALYCKATSNKMNVSFVGINLVKQSKNIHLFSYDIPITVETKNINIKTDLPFGYGLSDKIMVPSSPPVKEVGTDGRKIFIKWSFSEKSPDDIIPIRLYYERIDSSQGYQKYYIIIILSSVFVISVLIILYLRILKKKPELVLSVLNEAERIIVEILQQQPEDEVDQRKLVALSGFSKAKVSRIIQNLEERGVVETERQGRKNKVKLKKKFVKEETEQSEN
ncbi:MAG: hypothetical protein QXM68_01370 [Candidatus Aenigmatarchaeota archaeon]|nr:hypothetical protein [Candidatus Aenigmarchaeota archaeon]